MCGKNRYILCSSTKTLGSPPRVREKRLNTRHLSLELGITPACAGKTYIQQFQFKEYEDHPRVCGKNWISWTLMSVWQGSPPRVREKLFAKGCRGLILRITPASAGKTCLYLCDLVRTWDHPRECGKNSTLILLLNINIGSPPRVREKHTLPLLPSDVLGITPACAGKTYIV